MKKKTTWAASVVKKQLQTCCKHQPAFSLDTTERDDNMSQEIHISSPIKEPSNPLLLRRRSFTVSHAKSLLMTPEPLTPFRKSVESAIPLCRSSTFKSGGLQNHRPEEEEVVVVAPSKPGKVLHKSGPLPVLQQLFRMQGASPLIVKKQLSGPLISKPRSAAPSPKQSILAGPSPQRISKVKFSPIPHGIAATRKLADMIAEKEQIIATPVPDRERECHPVASSPNAKFVAPPEAMAEELAQDDVAQCGIRRDHVSAAAVRIQAAFRGYRARKRLECRNLMVSISTQMSRTDPQKQRRTPPPRATRGWNGSMRSAQDHQALLRSRQEAALKRERAMEYALSRQRWRTGGRAAAKGPDLDDRVPDKPGWVRSWLERASRMSVAQSSQNIEQMPEHPQSESLSVKSTVGMCTTDIGSADVNLGWPLSLRQQHAAGLLQPKTPIPSPLIETQRQFSTSTASSSDPSFTSELIQSSRRHDLESVGSCDGPVLQKLPSPVVAAAKPRKLFNSNSKRDQFLEFAQSQVSVALSDGDSADTTAASVQRPLWR